MPFAIDDEGPADRELRSSGGGIAYFEEATVSEPKAEATHVEEVVPGIWHWFVWDDRIGAESHAHAVSDEGGSVLIDPLPLRAEAPAVHCGRNGAIWRIA